MALTAKKVYAILKRQISDMEAKLNSPVRYRGTVATADLLPLNPDIGDMYNIESKSVYGEAGMNVAWNGVVWDTMGAPIDMSLYVKSNELADWVKQQSKPTYTAEEVGALPANTKIPSKTSDLQNDSGFLTKIPDNYLSGTDKTLSVSGKAADAKATGDKITELSADISNKLNKNQGSENSGKIAGINESGDIVPMFPVSVDYNEETNCLEFGSDQKMELNKGINLDSTLTKTGFAADAGAVGEITNSLKESISTKITKFYASSQGETHLADSDNGKIMDMMVYGKSEQKQYSGTNYAELVKTSVSGVEVVDRLTGTVKVLGQGSMRKVTEEIPAGTYTISYSTATNSIWVMDIKDSKLNSLDALVENTTILKKTFTASVPFSLYIGANTNTESYITINNLMLSKGLEAHAYEPYTGGIPSPNPDYPQEIKSVVNPTVKVCGKNLLNATLETTTKNGVTCKNNGDGTYTLNGTSTDYVQFESPICLIKKGKYALFGNPSDINTDSDFFVGILDTVNGYQIGGLSFSNDYATINVDSDVEYKLAIRVIHSGVHFDNLLFKPMIVDIEKYPGTTYDDFEPYHEQTVTLPYDLYGVKVASGGNVTIGGQQYVSDYFDVERGKLVRMVEKKVFNGTEDWKLDERSGNRNGVFYVHVNANIAGALCDKAIYESLTSHYGTFDTRYGQIRFYAHTNEMTLEEWRNFLSSNNHVVYIIRNTPEEIDLTTEEITALKELATYYPTTNISINSEQIDGYTIFNYPISMENGWNYVKQQIGDTREYIYDIDARTQDTDLQAAEAYVNSEYAVALTELEV